MNSRPIRAICGLALLGMSLVMPLGSASASGTVSSENCGVQSIVALARLLGRTVGESDVIRHLDGPDRDFSLLDLRTCARQIGIPVEGFRLSLTALKEGATPAIIHLRGPDHFAVLASVGSEYAILYDQGVTTATKVADLSRRFSGVCLVLAEADGGAEPRPRMHVEEPVRVVDFPTRHTTLTAEVALRNTGNAALGLGIGEKSCSCVGVRLSSTQLAPGESATLSVDLRKSGFGEQLQTLMLRTTDPLRPRVVISFVETSSKDVEVSPEVLAIRTPEGQGAVRSFTLRLARGASLVQCSSRNAFLRIKPGPPERAGQNNELRIDVTLSPNVPSGSFADEIVCELKGTAVPRVSVPIQGLVEPDIVASPAQAFFGIIAGGPAATRTVAVQSHSGRGFAIRAVEATAPGVAVKAACGVVAARHEVVIVVTPKAGSTGTVRDRARVILQDGRVLEVGVFAMVGGPTQNTAGDGDTVRAR